MKSKEFILDYLGKLFIPINDVTLHSLYEAIYKLEPKEGVEFLDDFVVNMKKRYSEDELEKRWAEQESLKASAKAERKSEEKRKEELSKSLHFAILRSSSDYRREMPHKGRRLPQHHEWRAYCLKFNLDIKSGRPK